MVNSNQLTVESKQVFYDPSGKRFKISLTLGIFIGVIVSLLIGLTANSLFKIYSISSSIQGLSYDSRSVKNTKQDIVTDYSYTYEEFREFKENYDQIDEVYFNAVKPVLTENKIILKSTSGEEYDRINTFIKTTKPSIKKTLQLTDIDIDKQFYEYRDNSFTVSTLINNNSYQDSFLEELSDYYSRENYSGFSLNLRDVTLNDTKEGSLKSFLKKIDTNLPSGTPIYLSINSSINKDKIISISDDFDRLIITVNPLQRVGGKTLTVKELRFEVENLLSSFPDKPKHLMIVNSNLLTVKEEENIISSQPVSYTTIGKSIQEKNLTFKKDLNQSDSLEYLEYVSDNLTYKLTLTDSVYIYNVLRGFENVTDNFSAIGVSDLALGDPLSISILNNQDRSKQKEILSGLKFDSLVKTSGDGDVIIPTANAILGAREVNYTDNWAESQKITKLPVSSQVEYRRLEEKNIALTFDDGPHPEYTPQILDILKEKNVKATFFVIGQNVAKYPELTNRIIEEGHVVGNHTFTHPFTYGLDSDVLIREIQATQNIIQEVTGTSAKYFRLPFSDSTTIDTDRDLERYSIIIDQGLTPSEYTFDTKDWLSNDRQAILDKFNNYDLGKGGQVLLHDGGINRSSTISALPELIENIKSKGYNLATVENIKSQAQEETISKPSRISRIGFFVHNLIMSFSSSYLFIFLIFAIFRYTYMWLLNLVSLFQRTSRKPILENENPLISAVIACYNEENSIKKTIDSILASTYSNLEIIIVNDGSTDKTQQIITDNYRLNKKVSILNIKNSGKSNAINTGLKIAKGDFIFSVDADTLVYPETVSKLLSQFDKKTGGVAGNIQVGNDNNLLTKNQRLEYINGQNFDKVAYQSVNSIMVIPGCLGLWRVEALKQSGGYKTDTLAEDADLTIRLIRNNWKIKYCKNAIAVTEAPGNLSSFTKQRMRWMYGTLQVIFKHRDMLFNPKYGWFGFLVLPEFFITYLFLPVTIIANFTLIYISTKVILTILGINIYLGSFFENNSLYKTILTFLLFMFLYSLTTILAIYRDNSRKKWSLLLQIPFNVIVYRQVLWALNIWVIFKAFAGRKALWNHFEKKGETQLIFPPKLAN
jgi:peptidoglycan-N-acetylglucosamine deacetylase